MHIFNYGSTCLFCSARRVECREGVPGSAGVFVGAAESREGRSAGGKHQLSSDRKTDAAGQAGMFCFHFLPQMFQKCICNLKHCAVVMLIN